MQRSKQIGGGITVTGHALLFAFFCFGLASATEKPVLVLDGPVEVNLVSANTLQVDQPYQSGAEPEAQPEIFEKNTSETEIVNEVFPEKEELTVVKKKPMKPEKTSEKCVQKTRDEQSLNEESREAKEASFKSMQAEQKKQSVLSVLLHQAEKYKRYPISARRLNLEGTIFVCLQINTAGEITDVHIEKEGGHALLQKAAAETIRKVQSNWQRIPVEKALSFRIPLRYFLVQ